LIARGKKSQLVLLSLSFFSPVLLLLFISPVGRGDVGCNRVLPQGTFTLILEQDKREEKKEKRTRL
jgi:hypothetical protein